jgi:hypothetical protein
LGGFVPRRVLLSSDDSEFLEDLEASDLWSSGEVMADGHLKPKRSACVWCVDAFDRLLKVATQNCIVPSSGRGSASSCRMLRSPATRMTGKMCLRGLCCNFSFFRGCLGKCCNVNFMNI